MKAYVTINHATHKYTATVRSIEQLENYLKNNPVHRLEKATGDHTEVIAWAKAYQRSRDRLHAAIMA